MGWALIVLVIAVVANGITLAVLAALAGALLINPVTLFGPLLAAVTAVCGVYLTELAAAILFLIGFHHAYAGRHEYGLEQSKAAERALIFLIIFILVSAVSAVYSTSNTLFLGSVGPTELPVLVGSLVLGPVAAFFAGMTLTHLVQSLAAPEARSRLRMALILGILAAGIGPALTLLATGGRPVTMDQVVAGAVAAAIAGQGIAAISLFLFWLAYQEIRRALQAGTPSPVLPRVDQVYPWLYRPWVAYPYPPAVPPPSQPPKT